MARVALEGIGKVYPNGYRAVTDVNLAIEDGEFLVFVGPSGCGKTTVLRMVAGLEGISEGELWIGDAVVNQIEPRKRDIAMVFQNYALYPHMSVFDNIAFPLRNQRVRKAEVRERVMQTARVLGLEDMLKRRPATLSGGQRQRVAMGRAMVREPAVFLMDEPLSNLDAKLRVQMRAEISQLHQELGVTTIYVTHDQVEAMTMGTRIAVMRKGLLQQVGTPQMLYTHPCNLFVATFMGAPAMNLLTGRFEERDGEFVCLVGEQVMVLPPSLLGERPALRSYLGREVAVGIRPEQLRDPRVADPSDPVLSGRITLVEDLGAERLIHIAVPAKPVLTDDVLEVARDIDASSVEHLNVEATEHSVTVISRREVRGSIAPGELIEVALSTEGLQFFDLNGGATIVGAEPADRPLGVAAADGSQA